MLPSGASSMQMDGYRAGIRHTIPHPHCGRYSRSLGSGASQFARCLRFHRALNSETPTVQKAGSTTELSGACFPLTQHRLVRPCREQRAPGCTTRIFASSCLHCQNYAHSLPSSTEMWFPLQNVRLMICRGGRLSENSLFSFDD